MLKQKGFFSLWSGSADLRNRETIFYVVLLLQGERDV
jgi:hypothetical protein